MAKQSWHTDIVVDGRGMGLRLKRRKDGCYNLIVKPDVLGHKTDQALTKFRKALDRQPPACTVAAAKAKVRKAVKATKARWNKWHREAYGK
jgi:hypothetical protein